METLSEAHDDSSGANPSSVKSEDGSPPPDDDRGSPPPNCAICLGTCRNKSFTDSCLHQFCFKCLVTWSKVKTECPLCKQVFKSIIHNVQSNHQYEEYRVEQRLQEGDQIEINDLVTATRRFRYRTTLTFPRGRDHIALQRLLMHYPPLTAMVGMSRDLPGITPAALPSSRRRRSPSSFRRTVYRHNLWARPLPDFTGRHRDCTPEFYRYNDSQMHRLVPWLDRELHYLLMENAGHITYVQSRILDLLPRYHITSPEFRAELYRYLGARTDHFLHELHCFASTPYDLTGYDRNVQYTTDSRISNAVNDVLSSSDTESDDSDIVVVSEPARSLSADPYPGASAHRLPEPVYPRHSIAPVDEARRNIVIPIETISHSDTDDDEVMVTGYIKPPSQRTPEVVDLRDSDSDVVLTEGPSQPPRGVVQLTLSRPRPSTPTPTPAAAPAPAPGPGYTPPPPMPSPRARPRYSTEDESTSPARDASPLRRNKRRRTRRSRDAAPSGSRTPERDPREKDKRKKSKSTNGKGVKSSRKVDAAPVPAAPSREPQPGPSSQFEPPSSQPEPTASRSEPSSSGTAGKLGDSSRRRDDSESRGAGSASVQQEPPRRTYSSRPERRGKRSRKDEARESPRRESRAVAQPSAYVEPGAASGSSKRKSTDETSTRRPSRESKRLRSVVKKASSWNSPVACPSSADSGSGSAGRASPAVASGSGLTRENSIRACKRNRTRERSDSSESAPPSSDFTDSDDDIPLNLTIKRSAGRP